MRQLVIKCLLYHTEQHRLRVPLEILVIVSTRVMSQMQQKLFFINVRLSCLEVSPEQMFVEKIPKQKIFGVCRMELTDVCLNELSSLSSAMCKLHDLQDTHN